MGATVQSDSSPPPRRSRVPRICNATSSGPRSAGSPPSRQRLGSRPRSSSVTRPSRRRSRRSTICAPTSPRLAEELAEARTELIDTPQRIATCTRPRGGGSPRADAATRRAVAPADVNRHGALGRLGSSRGDRPDDERSGHREAQLARARIDEVLRASRAFALGDGTAASPSTIDRPSDARTGEIGAACTDTDRAPGRCHLDVGGGGRAPRACRCGDLRRRLQRREVGWPGRPLAEQTRRADQPDGEPGATPRDRHHDRVRR